MKNKKIVVVGSTNTDMVVKSSRIPAPGETILGGNFFMNAGGKGANQAVAAARLGGDVTFIAKTGNDIFGKQALELFTKEGINCSYLFVDETAPSGVALITLNANGQRSCKYGMFFILKKWVFRIFTFFLIIFTVSLFIANM